MDVIAKAIREPIGLALGGTEESDDLGMECLPQPDSTVSGETEVAF